LASSALSTLFKTKKQTSGEKPPYKQQLCWDISSTNKRRLHSAAT